LRSAPRIIPGENIYPIDFQRTSSKSAADAEQFVAAGIGTDNKRGSADAHSLDAAGRKANDAITRRIEASVVTRPRKEYARLSGRTWNKLAPKL
jgi:hypothetical protein